MSAYNELVKNFERIRTYMRDFYVYGFKSRHGYDKKSSRSYDDERRRIESWLGDYMGFSRTPEGKCIFISIDSRTVEHNPLHASRKTKSFTDGDITLHFILFDILHSPEVRLSLPEIIERIDRDYLAAFDSPMSFDESTVRKKLGEYAEEGIICREKLGRSTLYRRADDSDISGLCDAIGFFSEVSPCGAVGSYLLDKAEAGQSPFGFKHHYIMATLDDDVTFALLQAMHSRASVTVTNRGRGGRERRLEIVPLRIFVSVQGGRQHLLAYDLRERLMHSYRIDYLSDVTVGEPCPQFDELRERLCVMQRYMWGVNCKKSERRLEHVEFTVFADDGEEYIPARLERERRCGRVEQVDEHHWRFIADVYDSTEMLPWIRTFICRITKMSFSNRTVENRFRDDVAEMCRMYGLEGGERE